MSESETFLPKRLTGVILHILLLVLVTGGIGVLLTLAFSDKAGDFLVLLLLASMILLGVLPLIAYRGYALLHATYHVERDGLRVRWGLRSEDIPLPEITWVGETSELGGRVPLPAFAMPGAILGKGNLPEFGEVEFIASSSRNLVIVSSINKTIIISPDDPRDFVRRFQRVIEMGSLTPIPVYSVVPAAYLGEVLADRISRFLIILTLALPVLLLIITGLLTPSRVVLPLGFDSSGIPLPPVSANRLLLLPVIATGFSIADLIAGLFFYRQNETRMIAHLVWAAGAVTAFLLTVAMFVLFFTPV